MGEMDGKTVLITGATNGIGKVTALELAKKGATVVIVGRNPAKTSETVAEIKAQSGNPNVESIVADLSSMAEVRKVADAFKAKHTRLDVLINNAGAMYARRQATEDGIELTWAVNHLAPFLLTTLLLDRLKEGAPARIVTTASAAHQGARIPFEDLNAERSYRGFERYGQTKLANILFTRELARRLEGTGVSATCFHPGLVATGFNRNNGLLMDLGMTMLRPVARSPEKGAETLVWLATSPEAASVNGGYYFDKRYVLPSAEAQNMDTARRLWEVSEAQCASPRPKAETQ